MTILFIDGANLMFRARSGFQLGEFNVVFNFFRGLKALVEQFKPTRVYFSLEGHPKKRYDLMPSYKANRHAKIDPDKPIDAATEKKMKSDEDYRRQQGLIIDLLKKHFPVSVLRHADYEGDDVIFNVIHNASSAVKFTVVSSDTDFIQLFGERLVELYNPITKKFIEPPDHDYVMWKALRGDGSDNIPGLPGIGDKTATELLKDPDRLQRLFENKDLAAQYERNVALIRFPEWTTDEMATMESSSPQKDWEAVAETFKSYAFQSIIKEPYWEKFKQTFDTLWP